MEAGARFGDYTILKRLATGGMAEVYLARRTGAAGFSKPVAIKVILPHLSSNQRFVKMFLDEARLAVYLEHAHIAQTLDLGQVEDKYFIAMEFAHGVDLQRIGQKTKKSGRLLPLPYAAKIVSQVAEGLFYAHSKTDPAGNPLGIIHRDVSPHNILLTFEGMAKLIDFGVAKARLSLESEDEGVLKGKFSYMSPEQIRGMPLDARSDIFALGIVLWEICTGANLYRESSELLTMEAILRRPVPRPRELRGDMPPELEAIILKALAKRTVDRFESAHDMHVALENYLARSGWTVGAQHLAAFMHNLFPDEYEEIRKILEDDRRRLEAEERRHRESFVPWEPYEQDEPSSDELPIPESPPPARPEPLPAKAAKSFPPRRASGGRSIKILLLLLVVLLLGAIVATLVWQRNRQQPTPVPRGMEAVSRGSLRISSQPPGAKVTVSGMEVGLTPTEVNQLPLGQELTVRLEKAGYRVLIQPVVLDAASPQKDLSFRLIPL